MAEELGSVREKLVLRLGQNEPVVEVIQDARFPSVSAGKEPHPCSSLKCGEPGTAQRKGPCIDKPLPQR